MDAFVGSWSGRVTTGCRDREGKVKLGIGGQATVTTVKRGERDLEISFDWSGFGRDTLGCEERLTDDQFDEESLTSTLAGCLKADPARIRISVTITDEDHDDEARFDGVEGYFRAQLSIREIAAAVELFVHAGGRSSLHDPHLFYIRVGNYSWIGEGPAVRIYIKVNDLQSQLPELDFPVDAFAGEELFPVVSQDSTLEQQTRRGISLGYHMRCSSLNGVWASNVGVMIHRTGQQAEICRLACEYSLLPTTPTTSFPAYASPHRFRIVFFRPLLRGRIDRKRPGKKVNQLPLRKPGDPRVEEIVAMAEGVMGRHGFYVYSRGLNDDNEETGALRRVAFAFRGYELGADSPTCGTSGLAPSGDSPMPKIRAFKAFHMVVDCSIRLLSEDGWLEMENVDLPLDTERSGLKDSISHEVVSYWA